MRRLRVIKIMTSQEFPHLGTKPTRFCTKMLLELVGGRLCRLILQTKHVWSQSRAGAALLALFLSPTQAKIKESSNFTSGICTALFRVPSPTGPSQITRIKKAILLGASACHPTMVAESAIHSTLTLGRQFRAFKRELTIICGEFRRYSRRGTGSRINNELILLDWPISCVAYSTLFIVDNNAEVILFSRCTTTAGSTHIQSNKVNS